ncbi:MAG: putative ABC transporter permease [Lachnospiraceae bacterium]|nr:putative ABC transporter permease [Lachnospiraceae bacterium]
MFDPLYIFAYFIYYAVAGWCLEEIYAAYAYKKFLNRGFLSGPVCPIYGVGALIVVWSLSPFEHIIPGKPVLNLILLFICSIILTTLLELIVGWILERFFHQRWWDYTDDPLNYKGIVCVPFSLIWGACCVALLKIIHPFVTFLISKIPFKAHIGIFCVFYSLFLFDLIFTIAELAKIGRSIRLASDLDRILNNISGLIGKPLSTGTIFSLEQKDRLDKACRGLIGKAKAFYGEHYKDYRFKLSPVHKRIQNAYPDLRLTDTENVGAKISRLSDLVGRVKTAFDKNSGKIREMKERRARAGEERKKIRAGKKNAKRLRKQEEKHGETSRYGSFANTKTAGITESKPAKKGRNNKRKKQFR